jgi:hypothetical protein
MTTQEIAPVGIPRNKRNLLLSLLVCAGFVVACLFVLYVNEEQNYQKYSHPSLVRAALVVCVAFFGLAAVYAGRTLLDASPGLVIDAEGIIDDSGPAAVGRIPWSDIRGFGVAIFKMRRYLTVDVEDPDKYVQRAHPLKRPWLMLNARILGSPVQIVPWRLKIGLNELLTLVRKSHAKQAASLISRSSGPAVS